MSYRDLLHSFNSLGISLSALTLPSQRFFTPTEEFFSIMEGYKHDRLVECGAGRGETSRELKNRGYDTLAIDLLERDGQDEDVLILDALYFPFADTDFVYVCRPDHSGWVEELMERALIRSGSFAYVGLERNLERDLWSAADTWHTKFLEVGEEGEHMWLWTQQF